MRQPWIALVPAIAFGFIAAGPAKVSPPAVRVLRALMVSLLSSSVSLWLWPVTNSSDMNRVIQIAKPAFAIIALAVALSALFVVATRAKWLTSISVLFALFALLNTTWRH